MSDIFIHKSAIVETKDIGAGTKIWAFAHVLPGARIGSNVNICDHCFIENKVVVGNNVTLKCGVYLWDGVSIEDNVFVGPAAAFTNDLRPRSKNTNYRQEITLLKKGCSIGAHATILAGRTIGAYAMIGAGAVVTKDIPDFSLAYGNPAGIKGYICICTEKLNIKDNEICSCVCGRQYQRQEERLICTRE